MTFPNRLVPRLCARGCVSGMCFIWIHLNYKNLQHDFSYPSKTNLVQNTRNIKEHFRGKIVTSTRTPGLCWPRDQKNNCEGHIHSVKDILSRRPHLKRFTNKNWLICSRRSCPLPTSIGYGLKILSESYELYWFLGWICTVSLKIGMLWIDRVSFQRAVFSSNFWMGLPRIKQIPQQIYLYIIVICISIYIYIYYHMYIYICMQIRLPAWRALLGFCWSIVPPEFPPILEHLFGWCLHARIIKTVSHHIASPIQEYTVMLLVILQMLLTCCVSWSNMKFPHQNSLSVWTSLVAELHVSKWCRQAVT